MDTREINLRTKTIRSHEPPGLALATHVTGIRRGETPAGAEENQEGLQGREVVRVLRDDVLEESRGQEMASWRKL